jgi:hypothetical protein
LGCDPDDRDVAAVLAALVAHVRASPRKLSGLGIVAYAAGKLGEFRQAGRVTQRVLAAAAENVEAESAVLKAALTGVTGENDDPAKIGLAVRAGLRRGGVPFGATEDAARLALETVLGLGPRVADSENACKLAAEALRGAAAVRVAPVQSSESPEVTEFATMDNFGMGIRGNW